MLQLWENLESAPTLTWWPAWSAMRDITPAARAAASRETRCATRTRVWSFLNHLDRLGVTDQVTFLLTADHGFEGSDPTVTGSWRPALEGLATPFRDEGPGFIYILPVADQS
jgi:phosphonoacetate hydrolase